MVLFLVIFSLLYVGFIVRSNVGFMNITNPIVPLYYYHTVFFLVALAYMGIYEHIEISGNVIYMILYGYVALFSSAVLFCRMLGVNGGNVVAASFARNVTPRYSFLLAAFVLQTFFLLLMLFFYSQKGILVMIDDADNYRVEARKGLGFLIVLFRWVSTIFVIVGSLYFLSMKKVKWQQIRLFCVYYLVTIVFMLGLGSRALAFDLVVIAVGTYYWSRRKDFDYKLILVAVCLFAMLGLIGAVRQGFEVDAYLVYLKALWRPFVNIQNFQWVVSDFSSYNLLYGKSLFIEFQTLLPGYQPNFGTWYKDEFGYWFSGGSITITYLGEAFANFGYAGVMIFPILLGFIVALIASFFQKRITFCGVFLSIMASVSLKGIVSVGLGATLVGTLFPVVFCLGLFFLAQFVLVNNAR